MAQSSSTFDNEDYDSFFELNTDSNNYTPASASPATGSSIPSYASSSHSFGSNHPQQVFPAPTFQYDAYRQQTGLPVGGLANTFAVSKASGLQYNYNSGFVMPTETLNVPLSKLTDFDFAQSPSLPDMDYENEAPADMPPMFYPSGSNGHFVEPASLSGQDDSPTYTAPVQRMYPGMHSQQAAQAKAKQEESLRQQQQSRQIPGQRPLPSQLKTSSQKDPVVEQSISRLLNQMRQNSVASIDDEASTPTDSAGNSSRIKKDEDDMDEDERLLASEEGKKLSSKERRQLRNKVSARAFRSRRKEYIGQLEGEVAVKAQEVHDLKVQNRQLMEENTRLTDLTKMLLSSPAFSTFLTELSASGLPPPQIPGQSQQTPRPQPTRKDVNPHQAARQMQNQPQIGMALVPEPSVDFSMLETPTNGWSSRLPSNDFQVFATPEVPQGPGLDITAMSEKRSDVSRPVEPVAAKKDSPTIEHPARTVSTKPAETPESTQIDPTVSLDENAFSLYFEPSRQHATQAPATLSDLIMQQKPTAYALLVNSKAGSEDLTAELKRSCAALDVTCERVAAFTFHM